MTQRDLKFYLAHPVTTVLAIRQSHAALKTEVIVSEVGDGGQMSETIKECLDAFDDIDEVHFGYEETLKRMINLLQRN